MGPPSADPIRHRESCLAVANYRPDIGFAWWLMENFWVELQSFAESRSVRTILAYPQHGRIPQRVAQAAFDILFEPFPGAGLSEKWRALHLVRTHRIRLVYLTDRGFTSWFYVLLRFAGVRCIVNHDHTPGDRPTVPGLRGALKSVVARLPWINSDMQLVVSPLMRQRAIRNARLPSSRVVVVQNGIPPERTHCDPGYAHRVLALPESARICISAGRVTDYKRVSVILDIASRIGNDAAFSSIVFVHCGEGPDLDALRDRVKHEGLQERVLLLGRREDVHDLMRSSALAIHPSRGEAFSLAILEYMRASLPVVVPDVPSVRQAVEHGVTGLVYRDGDIAEAARAVVRIARDRDFATQLGAKGAERARTIYSLQETNRQFREALALAFLRLR